MTDPVGGFVLGTLSCLALLAFGRGLALGARGVRIFPVDRERTRLQVGIDLGFLITFLLWFYETAAFALALDLHGVPTPLRVSLLEAPALAAAVARGAGVVAMAAGLATYGFALHAFGDSWRLGIDRDRAGSLVTKGIFARSRNPVYLGLLLLQAGSFLVSGRLDVLLLALVCFAYFEHLIRREEPFLRQRYGEAYAAYESRVGRWWTVRRPRSRSGV